LAERQFAAGGVVIKKEEEKIHVLLVKDSYGHWTWPKGHIEKGETAEKAAMREISEETGLEETCIVEKLGEQEYYFTLKGKKIFKTVYIFLLEADPHEKLIVQKAEIREARWFPPEEALETIEYKGSKALLEKGIRTFKEKS